MAKGPEAFRTISEAADELHVPQHVLRFWETKFAFIRPMKRAGGRRFYRPADIAVLKGVRTLLHDEGYTIKGVQRLLREGGGQLSDDIPPPTADERAAAEAEKAGLSPDEPMLIPGLELVPPPASVIQLARAASKAKPDPEIEQLRSLLTEALSELEAIRALLG